MSSEKQRTIGKPVFYEGVGLHAGLPVHMTLKPAGVNEGICFVRTDLAGNPSVPANQSYVTNTMRATTQRNRTRRQNSSCLRCVRGRNTS